MMQSISQLRAALRYDPETGELFWRHRSEQRPQWNGRFAGKPALTGYCRGHRIGTLNGETVKAHRIAWAIYYGVWPTKEIDHINDVKDDNRIANLREADTAQNACNRGTNRNNTSGFKGVSWNKRVQKWHASIGKDRRQHHLGFFDTPEQAHIAYSEAAARLHGEFARLA